MKRIIALMLLGLSMIFARSTLAATEYSTSYESTYNLLNTGTTEVKHVITITNKLSHIYATSYTISIGSNNLDDINVIDETGRLDPEISTNENSTTINIPIETPAIGKDQTKTLTITYKNHDILEKAGNITEINIPRLSNANEVDSYTRKLITDVTFKESSNITPKPKIEEIAGKRIYTWTGFKNESITLFFGEYQLYQIDLKYTITNPTLNAADTEIAIPPDTEYQKVYLEEISPEPKSIKVDADGNWLAIYPLESKETKDIKVSLVAKLSSVPTYDIPYPEGHLKNLTQKTEYWDTQSLAVANLAEQLKTPENVYDYLVDNFSYNYGRVKTGASRLGSSDAISSPTLAICTEFTDAFVGLLRALNIPAREINGYAYTSNTSLRPLSLELDVLHAWPEYYDEQKGTWIQVDPTWGNTTGGIDYFNKLDYNHITFVRHGIEDSYPYPAGAYKLSAADKSVQVGIIYEEPEENIETEIIPSPSAKNSITVKNLSNVALINHSINTDDGKQLIIKYLPPYAEETISLEDSTRFSISDNLMWILGAGGLLAGAAVILILVKRKN